MTLEFLFNVYHLHRHQPLRRCQCRHLQLHHRLEFNQTKRGFINSKTLRITYSAQWTRYFGRSRIRPSKLHTCTIQFHTTTFFIIAPIVGNHVAWFGADTSRWGTIVAISASACLTISTPKCARSLEIFYQWTCATSTY